MVRLSRIALAAAALASLAGCGDRPSSAAGPFAAVRIKPDGELVFLNQALTVYFSEPVEPLSITGDTVRIVDGDGHPVAISGIDVGSQSISVRPRPPTMPSMDDGTLRPASHYTLEVAGYPQTNGVRSRDGRLLDRSIRRAFETVGLSGREDYRRPLLPVGMGDEPFTLDPARRLDALVATGELLLHFTLPPSPPSVTPAAFVVQAWDGSAEVLRRVAVLAASVVHDPGDRFFGSTVALRLSADPPLQPQDHVDLFIVQEGDHALVDYAGRAVRPSARLGGSRLQVHVQPGSHVRILDVDATNDPTLLPAELGRPGFEVRDGSRMTPQVRLAAGAGELGPLRPTGSMRFVPPVTLDQHGALVSLASLDVPEGVRLTITGVPGPLRLLVAGSVRIDGELLLETAVGPLLDPILGSWVTESDLAGLAGCVLIAAGDIHVAGRIVHVHEGDPSLGPAVALIAGGRLRLDGRVPPRTVVAGERDVQGSIQRGTPIQVRLNPGWGGVEPVRAEAWTQWHRVPLWHRGPFGIEVRDPRGSIQVLVQTSPAHPIDPARVDDRREAWSAPQPADALSEIPAGGFVRFALRAVVAPGGAELPSVRGIALFAR